MVPVLNEVLPILLNVLYGRFVGLEDVDVIPAQDVPPPLQGVLQAVQIHPQQNLQKICTFK